METATQGGLHSLVERVAKIEAQLNRVSEIEQSINTIIKSLEGMTKRLSDLAAINTEYVAMARNASAQPQEVPRNYEYKVIDAYTVSRISADINHAAADGWQLMEAVTTTGTGYIATMRRIAPVAAVEPEPKEEGASVAGQWAAYLTVPEYVIARDIA